MGLLLATVSYRYRLAEEILRPFMVFCKAVPVAVFAVLLLIWWGASPLAVAVCFLVVFPNIYLNTLEGLKSADAELIEMAEVFRLPFATRFFYIYRPALKPFLLSAFQLSLGMSWKSGVAAEVIGTPLHSIGGALYLAKIYLDTADLFAWTAVIIVLSVLFEKIVFGCVEYFFRWEPACKRPAMPQKNVSRERRTLCVADFGKCYHDRWIFRHVEQEFHGGEPYFLDTPSGSRKTDFFQVLVRAGTAGRGRSVGNRCFFRAVSGEQTLRRIQCGEESGNGHGRCEGSAEGTYVVTAGGITGSALS